MYLSQIAETSRRLAATQRRLEKVELLAACLRGLTPPEAGIGVQYLVGRLPQGRIGLGPAVLNGIAGGLAAGEGATALTLLDVDAVFARIARMSGPGTAAERKRLLGELFSRASAQEQGFLARLIVGELRQGALEGLMVEAIARAAGIDAERIRRAVMLAGDPAPVAGAVLAEGAAGLSRFALQVLQPVKPMLAQTAQDVGEALERLGDLGLEYKLDGARVQVHKAGDRVAVFSRRLNEVTPAVPELVEAVRALPERELILDGEVLALRPDGRPHPFQVTMRRFGRRLDVERLRAELPLAAYFFDCLHRNGADLIDRPGEERFAALADALPSGLVIPRLVTRNPVEAEAFLEDALRRGHEGIMVKALAAPYEAGNRGSSWLKVKPAHTLDLVVLAAEWGHGRRRGWLSNLHLGARDPATGGFVMLGKTFKGMTDEMLAWQTRKLQALKVAEDAYTVYVRPKLVVEIAFNDVQSSPQYPGGLALRFARVKGYRPDKQAGEADTIETVRALQEVSGLLSEASDS